MASGRKSFVIGDNTRALSNEWKQIFGTSIKEPLYNIRLIYNGVANLDLAIAERQQECIIKVN